MASFVPELCVTDLFGFKIADRDIAGHAPVLDYALTHRRPIEVGLYFGEADALRWLERELADAPIPVNAHTNHDRFTAFDLDRTWPLLEAHIEQARRLGSRYSVLHAAWGPLSLRPPLRDAVIARLLNNLEKAEELCEKADYRLHLENVFHPLSFYRELFAAIHARGLKRIHFCFDIGHAKIWSGETLDEWLAFTQTLVEQGFLLHSHLHANQGMADEHWSMAEASAAGITAPDGYYNPYGYPAAFWQVERRFPNAIKIFEVAPGQAIAHMESVLAAG